jgi:hypothetical protein
VPCIVVRLTRGVIDVNVVVVGELLLPSFFWIIPDVTSKSLSSTDGDNFHINCSIKGWCGTPLYYLVLLE